MSLNDTIVEDAALAMPMAALTPAYAAHPHPAYPRGRGDGEKEVREAIRRLNPAIPEEARATIRSYRIVQISIGRETTP